MRRTEVVTGDRYLGSLVKFVEKNIGPLIEGSLLLRLNPVGLHYVCSRIEALNELEGMITGAPVDYLRAYISDLGDHRAIEQLRRILCRLTTLKVVSALPQPSRDPTPLSLVPFGRLKVLELRRCNLSTSAAKGLLELRHTLEKLICHDSTDALRHVFASRITDIKDSPQWNRLSFVSCACNRLFLMDESLQLLTAVEILDLSRNKFAKVDNLRSCSKLIHLDLGFNQLRSVSSLREITSRIRKLVLRNNALTCLQGIEKLKSLEGLDLSNNIISSFQELEVLSALPSLENLWLEGNPLCSDRWYKPQVFSFFTYPDRLKLDDKEISTIDFWRRQFIINRRHRKPASYGFYSPAKEEEEEEEFADMKTKKFCRVVAIQNENRNVISVPELPSFDNEIHSGDTRAASADEAGIIKLGNKRDVITKDHSALWLQGSKERAAEPSEDFGYGRNQIPKDLQIKDGIKVIGESSKHVQDFVQFRNHRTSNLESPGFASGTYNQLDSATMMGSKESLGVDHRKNLLLTTLDDVSETRSSSLSIGSPPQYREDILFRRQDLEEGFSHLSDESFSIPSSDTDTSEDETFDVHAELPYNIQEPVSEVGSLDMCRGQQFISMNGENVGMTTKEAVTSKAVDLLGRIKRRVTPLREESSSNRMTNQTRLSCVSYENNDFCGDNFGEEEKNISRLAKSSINVCLLNDDKTNGDKQSSLELDHCVEHYFSSVVGDTNETSVCYVFCSCIVIHETQRNEWEVVVVVSSERKLYLLPANPVIEGADFSVISSHNVENVSDILVGLGLQVLRVHIEDTSYVYVTKSAEKTRQLLDMFEVTSQDATTNNRCLRSLDRVQLDLFTQNICRGSEVGINQYSMVYFSRDERTAGGWAPRSLFVVGGHLIVCIEDVKQFSSLLEIAPYSPYFLLDSLCHITDITKMVVKREDNCCVVSTCGSSQMESCLSGISEFLMCNTRPRRRAFATQAQTWRLKWPSQENLVNFVSLCKAIHSGTAMSTLSI